MNFLVRVVKRRLANGSWITTEIFNEVVNAVSTRKAVKTLRNKYGPSAAFGLIRKTDKEEGIYYLEEKELKCQQM